MTLGDLEFKAEDFIFESIFGDGVYIVAEASAKEANRLLKERLEKAPAMGGTIIEGKYIMHNGNIQTASTHRARLVCIEEIGK